MVRDLPAAVDEALAETDIATLAPPAFSHTLPQSRNVEENPFRIRGKQREEWEPHAADLKDPELEGRVGRIGDNVPHVEHVRKKRRRSPLAKFVPGWESGPRQRQRRTSRRMRRMLVASVSLAFIAVVLVGAWAVKSALAPAPPPSSETSSAVGVPALVPGTDTTGLRDFPTVAATDHERALEVMKNFFAARTPQELLRVICDPERVGSMITAYYREHSFRQPKVRKLPGSGDMLAYKNIILSTIEIDDYEARIVAVEKTSEGYFVDWESYVGWCEVPWEKLAETRPLAPVVMRARVDQDDYYNHAFADADRFGCYNLSSLQRDQHIYGYVERSSALYADLQSRTRLNPLILAVIKIRYPSKTGTPDQVEITEIVEDGWVLQDEDAKLSATPQSSDGPPAKD
ncbi:MAG: hypothetical protein ACR2OZ_09360 [Verrucomicrobiales bacterium]